MLLASVTLGIVRLGFCSSFRKGADWELYAFFSRRVT
jgi:hypothetical protein